MTMLQTRTISAARSATVIRSSSRIWPTSTPRLSSSGDVGSTVEVYDGRAGRNLRRAGWTLVRVWEHENPVKATDRVQRALGR